MNGWKGLVFCKTVRFSISYLAVLVFFMWACQPKERPEGIAYGFRAVPLSFISADLKLPISALESGINKSLISVLSKEAIQLNGRKDSLYLVIRKSRDIRLAYQNQQIYAAVPVKVSAVIKKKVLGMVLTNKEQPLVFSAVATVSGPFSLDEHWNLNYDFKWRSLEWEQPPVIDIMGFRLDLTELVDKQIEKMIPNLNQKINAAIQQGTNLSAPISKALVNIEKPIELKGQGFSQNLQFDLESIRGTVVNNLKDTLALHIEASTKMTLSPEPQKTKAFQLPVREEVRDNTRTFKLFVEVVQSFEFINEQCKIYEGESFEFEETSIRIESLRVYPQNGYIQCDLSFSGDQQGDVTMYGIPALAEDHTLILDQFGYDFSSESSWARITESAFHSAFEGVLSQALNYSLKDQISTLQQQIPLAVERSRIGGKLNLTLQIDKISLHDLGLTDEQIQFIVRADGLTELQLEQGIFNN